MHDFDCKEDERKKNLTVSFDAKPSPLVALALENSDFCRCIWQFYELVVENMNGCF